MIGIMQGRLSQAPKNKLQFYPKDPLMEILNAKKIGLDYIELFSEEKFNSKNIIWNNNDLKNFILLANQNKIKIYSFCDNYVINNSIFKKQTQKYLENLLKILKGIRIKKFVLPLYEESEINEKNYIKFLTILKKISILCSKYNIVFTIECNLNSKIFKILKKIINRKNFYITFDTGNQFLKNVNFFDEVLLYKKDIAHIHLKDRDKFDKNVLLGKGLVNFKNFFLNLKRIRYKGSFSIESTRGKNFLNSAKKNKQFFHSMMRI
jgi:sugar phosphate isomerase/epimerase